MTVILLREGYESEEMCASELHHNLSPAPLKMFLLTMQSRGVALELVDNPMAEPHALALLKKKLGGLGRLSEERPHESQSSEPRRRLPVKELAGQKLGGHHVADLV